MRVQAYYEALGFVRYAQGPFIFSLVDKLVLMSQDSWKRLFSKISVPPQRWLKSDVYANVGGRFMFDKIEQWDTTQLPSSPFRNPKVQADFLKKTAPNLFYLRERYKSGDCNLSLTWNEDELREWEIFTSATQLLRDQIMFALALLPNEDFWMKEDKTFNEKGEQCFPRWLSSLLHYRAIAGSSYALNAAFFYTLGKYGINLRQGFGILNDEEMTVSKDHPAIGILDNILNFEMPEGALVLPHEAHAQRAPFVEQADRNFNETMTSAGAIAFIPVEHLPLLDLSATMGFENQLHHGLSRGEFSDLTLYGDLFLYHRLRMVNQALQKSQALGFGWLPGQGFSILNPKLHEMKAYFREAFQRQLALPLRYRWKDLPRDSLLMGAPSLNTKFILETEKELTHLIEEIDKVDLEAFYGRMEPTDPNREKMQKEILDYELERFHREMMELSIAQDPTKNMVTFEKKITAWATKAKTHSERAVYLKKIWGLYQTLKVRIPQKASPMLGKILAEWMVSLDKDKAIDPTFCNSLIHEFEKELLGKDPNVAMGFLGVIWCHPGHFFPWRDFKTTVETHHPQIFERILMLAHENRLENSNVSADLFIPGKDSWFSLLETGDALRKWRWAKTGLTQTPTMAVWNKIRVILDAVTFSGTIEDETRSEITVDELIDVATRLTHWMETLSIPQMEINTFAGVLPDLVKSLLFEQELKDPLQSTPELSSELPNYDSALRVAYLFPTLKAWLEWLRSKNRNYHDEFLSNVRPADWSLQAGWEKVRADISAESLRTAMLGYFLQMESLLLPSIAPSYFGSIGSLSQNVLPVFSNVLEANASWILLMHDVPQLKRLWKKTAAKDQPLGMAHVFQKLEAWVGFHRSPHYWYLYK